MTFAIQGTFGPTALGPFGGGLGFGPDNPTVSERRRRRHTQHSVAIKFDLVQQRR